MGDEDAKLDPLVKGMNDANSQYKDSAKHVKMHCQPPKAKASPKPGPKAKAKGRA